VRLERAICPVHPRFVRRLGHLHLFSLCEFKFAATLQAAQGCDKPTLIRIETKAGHGAGKPTTKIIEETADRWAFLVKELGLKSGK
jgi:hypothetical protein